MQMLAFLWWIIFGLIVGVIAKLLMPGRDPGGFFVTILIGIAGSLIGGFLGRSLGLYGPNQQAAGFFMSVIGAIILLVVYRFIVHRRRLTP
jgi:uncharacterized membrane protein YeaQ/YmgE (transglycosylase-associated protein family)